IAFLVGCTALICGALPTCAAGLGWKVLSYQSVKEPEVCFYGSANVYRANGLLSVWTKCLAKDDLDNAVKADSTGSLSDIAAEKITNFYSPPFEALNAVQGKQSVDAVSEKKLANTGNIRPFGTSFGKIDCKKSGARDFIFIIPADGQVRSSDAPQDWQRVPNV